MLRSIFCLLLVLGITTSAWSQDDTPDLDNFTVAEGIPKSLADAITQFPDSTEIAVAIIGADGLVSFYGCRRSKDTLKAVDNNNALFQIGSVSKVFTATSLAKMVINGEIKLEDPINEHFDFTFKDEQQISFQELATHHSGLARMPLNMVYARYDDPYRDYDGTLLEALLAEQLDLNDKTYAYSNLGAGLLGYTLAKIRGTSYEQLITDLVTGPLELKNTGVDPRRLSPAHRVQGRNYEGKPTSDWHFKALTGAGGLYSTAADLSRFVLAQFEPDKKALALSRRLATTVNDNYSMALGWHILHKPERNDWWYHDGAVGGFVSCVVFDPKEKTGVVVLSNVSAFHPKMQEVDKLCFDLMMDQTKE